MSLFRSAEMRYFEIFIPKEDGYEIISKLAHNNFVQLLDASKDFHKPYSNSIKRCEEIVHRIDAVLGEAISRRIPLPEIPMVETVFERQSQILAERKISALKLLDEIEDEINSQYATVEKMTRSLGEFQRKILELEDYKYLLFKAREIFGSKKDSAAGEIDFSKTSLEQLRLANIAGIVSSKDIHKFAKIVFRATKSNSILYTFSIPKEDDCSEPRHAFIVVLESGVNMLGKVRRICQSFNAKTYRVPTNKEEVFDKIKQIEDNITDTKQLWAIAEKNVKENLHSSVAVADYGCGRFEAYRIIMQKEFFIFNAMNSLEEQYGTLIARIWVAEEKVGLLKYIVPSFVNIRAAEPHGKPPTHFEINSFTAPFQEIINTYGVPRYQEVNPALFAISIFPFLFGVMFGDIGHGGVLLGFALFLIYHRSSRTLMPDIYNIRYLILLMGIFSFYAGWIYNEFFSIPLNVFGSCYGPAAPEEYAQKMDGCVYPFGFDPKWIRASNELNYFNSYKMKFAVIIGVLQMTFGIALKMLNTVHFRSLMDFAFEWIPQQIFFFCTFGYMCFLILFKWTINWGVERSTAVAPSIIGQMIALPLQLGSTEGKPLWDIESQQYLQFNLLLIALVCVPVMLIPKPLFLWARQFFQESHAVTAENDLDSRLNSSIDNLPHKQVLENTRDSSGGHTEEEHDISEIAVHQIIETIEFVLGSISNTASYLRLWALSLAHGQLSKVFLEKTLGGGMQSANVLVIVIGMYLFFNITAGVIMGMDTMECFLHALRLQWVEFNSKFFKADGWKFDPLSLEGPLQINAIAFRVSEE